MSNLKFIKISADGDRLPDDATSWAAVLLPDHGITFSATSVVNADVSQEECEAACKALTLAGHNDWDLPTVEELSLIIDRTRYSPAINTDFFQSIQNDWYWTKTAAAWSSASAWYVGFSSGYVSYLHRYGYGFALAARRADQ